MKGQNCARVNLSKCDDKRERERERRVKTGNIKIAERVDKHAGQFSDEVKGNAVRTFARL